MELKRIIIKIIFWVSLVVGIIMVLWRIFGDSPTDLALIAPFIVMLISKMWDMNEAIIELSHQFRILSVNTKSSFEKVREDIDNLKPKSGRK